MFVYKITFSFHVESINFLKLGYQILETRHVENNRMYSQSVVLKVPPSVQVTLIDEWCISL